MKKIYIDYNATTPLLPEVKVAMTEDLEIFGNASSMHTSGRQARVKIEQARKAISALIGIGTGAANGAGIGINKSNLNNQIIFTSGGSEANNMVFQTMRYLAELDSLKKNTGKNNRNEIITTVIEHPCVLNSAIYLKDLGYKVIFLSVDEYGKIKIDELKKSLNDKTLFVSVMAANNEIGTLQDIKEISAIVKNAGAYFHTDAVQVIGKIPINVDDLGVDYLTLSAHKIYGPKGVGALYVRKGCPLYPLIHGGNQEEGLRAGTYNNTGILGFGKAAEIAAAGLENDKYQKEMLPLREKLRLGLLEKIPKIKINGHPKDVLPNTLSVSFPGAEGEAILLSMDIQGIEASTGSACASASLDPSHVLLATGLGPELAHGSIRFSLGWGITEDEINYIIETLPPIINRLRVMSTLSV
jgi:cysteine desulfurase